MWNLLDRYYTLFDERRQNLLSAAGLCALRVFVGLTMLLAHGWPKLAGFSTKAAKFPDPLGVGSEASLVLAIFAEVFCSILLALGLFPEGQLRVPAGGRHA